MSGRRSLWDILSRRDPHGFYVIPLKRGSESLVSALVSGQKEGQVRVEEAGDVVLVRVKSRSLAERIVRAAEKRGLIAEEEEL